MNEKLKSSLWLIGFAIVTGTLLALYTVISGFVKFVFSLLALYLGIRFFRKFDSIAMRIIYIVCAILFFFIATFIFVAINFYRNPEMFG